jgi:acyl carrier protein
MATELIEIVNTVRANKGRPALPELRSEHKLRDDCGLDSLDLAELTVRIEEKWGIDVFADGVVRTVAEIEEKLARKNV